MDDEFEMALLKAEQKNKIKEKKRNEKHSKKRTKNASPENDETKG